MIYIGTLAFSKWISLVIISLNSGDPCASSTESTAAMDSLHSGALQALPDAKNVYPVVTSLLKRDATTNVSTQYAVCYAEVDGTASDTWYDSGIRLRTARWVNAVNNRIMSGSSVEVKLEINDGTLEGDHLVLVKDATTCETAPSSTNNFNGFTVRSFITNNLITLPSLAAGQSADLTEGIYIMCLCNRQGTSGACNTVNDFTLLIGAQIKIVSRPRLGQSGIFGNVRMIAGYPAQYTITGSRTSDLTLKNGDKLYIAENCNIIPLMDNATQTVPMGLVEFDDATGTAKFTTPVELDAISLTQPRLLRVCFATQETAMLSTGTKTAFVVLQETITIIPMPRLGLWSARGDMKAVSGSRADFQISQAAPGDLIFFRSADATFPGGCGTVPLNTTGTESAPFSMSQYNSSGSGMLVNPALVSNGQTTRYLKACFLPTGVDGSPENYVELPDELHIIPAPVKALIHTWVESDLEMLKFNEPLGHAGREGDFVILQRNNCVGVQYISSKSPLGGIDYSYKTSLEQGGVLNNFRLADAKVKELPAGKYKVCYATESSEGWSQNDWVELPIEIEITTVLGDPPPQLTVPDAVSLGTDIVAYWNASTDLHKRVVENEEWIGLYVSGACADGVGEGRHECFLAYRNLPRGESSGIVRFTQEEYKVAGTFDLRMFRGELTNAQGRYCKGLTKATTGTYLYCMNVAAVTSNNITVFGKVESMGDLSSVSGVEHVVLV